MNHFSCNLFKDSEKLLLVPCFKPFFTDSFPVVILQFSSCVLLQKVHDFSKFSVVESKIDVLVVPFLSLFIGIINYFHGTKLLFILKLMFFDFLIPIYQSPNSEEGTSIVSIVFHVYCLQIDSNSLTHSLLLYLLTDGVKGISLNGISKDIENPVQVNFGLFYSPSPIPHYKE